MIINTFIDTKAYVIVSWYYPDDVSVILNENGDVMLFSTYKETEKYAKEELDANWKIVNIY